MLSNQYDVTVTVEVFICFRIFYLHCAIGSFTVEVMLKQGTDLRHTKLLVFEKPKNTSPML